MNRPPYAIARGRQGHWEAICLDFDIAVQGRTFEEVSGLMAEAVTSYVDDAMKESETARAALLSRRAPWHVRAAWITGLAFAELTGRTKDRRGHDGGTSSTTVPFAVPCHA